MIMMDDSPKVADENQEQTIKYSDFSIDHILNQAGSSFENNSEKNLTCDRIGENVERFQWLQCSRYCPPKVPRIHKKDVQKRQLGRHPRIPFTSYQLSLLEQKFRESPYLSSEEVIVLSKKLQLADIRVKIWFQNRRARERREKTGEHHGDNNTKEERKANTDFCHVNNRLSHFDRPKISHNNSSEESQNNQNISSVNTIKAQLISPALDFSTNSVLSLSRNVSEIFEHNCVSSPSFLAGSVPFFVPTVNLSKNKDVVP